MLVGWLILLLPGVGWDIMGYESEPLPSYPELINYPYSVKLITPLPRLFLWIIYRVLIPPEHHLARTRHPIRLHAQCIDWPAGHHLYYGHLQPLDVYFNVVEPRGVHRLL